MHSCSDSAAAAPATRSGCSACGSWPPSPSSRSRAPPAASSTTASGSPASSPSVPPTSCTSGSPAGAVSRPASCCTSTRVGSTTPTHAAAVDRVRAAARRRAGRRRRHRPVRARWRRHQRRRRTAYVDVAYAVDKLTTTQLDDASAVADESVLHGVQTELSGPLALLAKEEPSSELIGVGVAIIVLLVAFGSVVAMGLPIITALFGLFVGADRRGRAVGGHGRPGVLADPVHDGRPRRRHRLRAVHRHPPPPASARGHERRGRGRHGERDRRPGRAVRRDHRRHRHPRPVPRRAAGASRSMGVRSHWSWSSRWSPPITLLPGLLGLAGTKIDKLSIHRKSHVTKPADETFSGRWAHHVGSHPVRYAVLSLVALCAIAVPALSMRIGDARRRQRRRPARRSAVAYDLLADGFGPGFNGPIQVVVEVPDRQPIWARSIASTPRCGPTRASPPSPRPCSTRPATPRC